MSVEHPEPEQTPKEMQRVAAECGFVHISSPLLAELARIACLNETSLDEAA